MNPLNGIGGALLIDDCYSADPNSTIAALDWLQTITDEKHRAIFIFGDMDNLGEYNQRGHRAVGQRAAEATDLLITVGKDAALAGGQRSTWAGCRSVRVTYSVQDAVAQA